MSLLTSLLLLAGCTSQVQKRKEVFLKNIPSIKTDLKTIISSRPAFTTFTNRYEEALEIISSYNKPEISAEDKNKIKKIISCKNKIPNAFGSLRTYIYRLVNDIDSLEGIIGELIKRAECYIVCTDKFNKTDDLELNELLIANYCILKEYDRYLNKMRQLLLILIVNFENEFNQEANDFTEFLIQTHSS